MEFRERYPEERERKVEEHLRKVWTGEVKRTYSCIVDPVYRQVEDMEKFADLAVENILKNADCPGYNPPRLLTDFGTVSTAAYWGGKTYIPEGGCKFIDPIIYETADAQQAVPMDVAEGDAKKAVDLYKRVCEKAGTDRLYCSTIDFQGPLNTAALLWEQTDFMLAMYDEPEEVHKLLDRVTDHLIQIMKYFLKELPGKICSNVWPYIWLPSDIGIGITEDYMPLLSAELYKEFGLPYLERISREFGGVFIHCCGGFEHQIQNLKESDVNVLGLEFHYPHTRPEVLFDAFGGDVVFVPYLAPRGEKMFKSKAHYLRYLKDVMHEDTRFWFLLNTEERGFEDQLKVVKEIVGEE